MQAYNFSSHVNCIPADVRPVANAHSHVCTNVSDLELRAEVTITELSKQAAKIPPVYCTKYCHPWAATWGPLCVSQPTHIGM